MEKNLETRSGLGGVVQSKIGLLSVVSMFYAICCAGAYGVEEMIPLCGPGLTIVILIVLPIFWAWPYGMICAQLGSVRPVEGGKSIWVKEALGEFWFGIMAYCQMIWSMTCNTVYVVLAVGYLGSIVELTVMEAWIIKVALVVLFFIINILGLKEVSIVTTLLSIIILIMFALVAIVGFANYTENPMDPFLPDDVGALEGVGAGLGIAIWMYAGFDEISVFGGEIEGSQKLIPKALMIVIPLMALTYILPTAAGLSSIGQWESWSTEAGGIGFASVLTENVAPICGILFLIVAIIGQCSIFNVVLANGSRTILVLSDGHFGPQFLSKLTKKKGIPYWGLVLIAGATILLLPFSVTFLIVVEVFFMILVYILVVISSLILMKKIPEEDVPFKIPGGQRTRYVLGASVILLGVVTTLINGTDWFIGGIIWVLLLPILYILGKRKFGGLTKVDPEQYPVNPKTKLGYGDLRRIGFLYMGIGLYGILGRFFLQWYEGDWGEEYYTEEYGTGMFSDYHLMLNLITIIGIAAVIAGFLSYRMSKRYEIT